MPDDIPQLPLSEAQFLSVYFEELSAHNHRTVKDAEANAHSPDDSPGVHKEVVLNLSDDEDEDE